MKHGKNVQQLIIHKMSLDAVPRGGGMADGLKFLSSKETIAKSARFAEAWVKASIQVVRECPAPNHFARADDEAIAGEILRILKATKEAKHAG